MSCIYDDSTCKYYEEGHCDFPNMGIGYPYDAPCFGFDYEDDEDWILVSEQLPEEGVDVLCVTLAGARVICHDKRRDERW